MGRPRKCGIFLPDYVKVGRKGRVKRYESQFAVARRVYQSVKPYRIAHACLDKQRSVIYNFVAINLERIHEDISNLSKAFGIISVVFLVMAVMLLSYFVSQSLMDKMQTIGVLKAFGCNALNLVKIFVWEGLIVGGMVIVLSLPIVAISCAIINGVVNAQAVAGVAIFIYFTKDNAACIKDSKKRDNN